MKHESQTNPKGATFFDSGEAPTLAGFFSGLFAAGGPSAISPSSSFVVEGPPVGFIAAGSNKWSKRTSKVWLYADKVRKAYTGEPLLATKEQPFFFFTRCFFRNGTHPDPENVHKLVKDALFHKVRLGDKYTGGAYLPPLYDKENPRVEIFVFAVNEKEENE